MCELPIARRFDHVCKGETVQFPAGVASPARADHSTALADVLDEFVDEQLVPKTKKKATEPEPEPEPEPEVIP